MSGRSSRVTVDVGQKSLDELRQVVQRVSDLESRRAIDMQTAVTRAVGSVWAAYAQNSTGILSTFWTNIALDYVAIDTAKVGLDVAASGGWLCPRTGNYMISGALAFSGNAGGRRYAALGLGGNQLSGSMVLTTPIGNNVMTMATGTIILGCVVDDIITVMAFQDSGSTLTTSVAGNSQSALFIRSC